MIGNFEKRTLFLMCLFYVPLLYSPLIHHIDVLARETEDIVSSRHNPHPQYVEEDEDEEVAFHSRKKPSIENPIARVSYDQRSVWHNLYVTVLHYFCCYQSDGISSSRVSPDHSYHLIEPSSSSSFSSQHIESLRQQLLSSDADCFFLTHKSSLKHIMTSYLSRDPKRHKEASHIVMEILEQPSHRYYWPTISWLFADSTEEGVAYARPLVYKIANDLQHSDMWAAITLLGASRDPRDFSEMEKCLGRIATDHTHPYCFKACAWIYRSEFLRHEEVAVNQLERFARIDEHPKKWESVVILMERHLHSNAIGILQEMLCHESPEIVVRAALLLAQNPESITVAVRAVRQILMKPHYVLDDNGSQACELLLSKGNLNDKKTVYDLYYQYINSGNTEVPYWQIVSFFAKGTAQQKKFIYGHLEEKIKIPAYPYKNKALTLLNNQPKRKFINYFDESDH